MNDKNVVPAGLEWTLADSEAAAVEGWDVFDHGEGFCEIQKLDDAEKFRSDAEAIAHVYWSAGSGSSLHRKAIAWTLRDGNTWPLSLAPRTAAAAVPATADSGCESDVGAKLNKVYAERNALAVAFTKAACSAGWSAGRGHDDDPAKDWEPEWRHVLYVDLPDGRQVSWHMAPDQVPALQGIPEYSKGWDGTFVARDPSWCQFHWPLAIS